MFRNRTWLDVYKQVITILCYPLEPLDRWGRPGAVGAVLLGVGFMAVSWRLGEVLAVPSGSDNAALAMVLVVSARLAPAILGLAYCGFGLSRLVGREARLRRQYSKVPVPEPLPKQKLKDVLETRELPFFVCTRCRVVMSPGDCGGCCLRCDSEVDCLPVREHADRRTVWSSVY